MSKSPLRRICSGCKKTLAVPQRAPYCATCSTRKSREWRKAHAKPRHEKVVKPYLRMRCSGCGVTFAKPQRASYCTPCGVERTREWAKKNPEKYAANVAKQAVKTTCSACREPKPPNKNARCNRCDREYRQGRRDAERASRTKAKARWRAKNAKRDHENTTRWRKKHPARYAEIKALSWRKRSAEHAALMKRLRLPAHPSAVPVPDHKHCTRRSCRARMPLERKNKFCRTCWTTISMRGRVRRRKAAGAHTTEEWRRLLEESGSTCAYCGCSLTLRTATRDHVVSLARGGSNDIENIVPACRPCNLKKHVRCLPTRPGWLRRAT